MDVMNYRGAKEPVVLFQPIGGITQFGNHVPALQRASPAQRLRVLFTSKTSTQSGITTLSGKRHPHRSGVDGRSSTQR